MAAARPRSTSPSPASSKASSSEGRYWLAGACILAVFVLVLHLMGRIAWCSCGFGLWTSLTMSERTSQLLADPFSLTHAVHGIVFYWVIRSLARDKPRGAQYLMALLLEISWELLENSPPVIARYRNATAAFGYTGDSILNSVGDVCCCLLGFWVASRLNTRLAALLIVIEEIILLLTIRDNLTLNVLMLLFPLESLKQWQLGG